MRTLHAGGGKKMAAEGVSLTFLRAFAEKVEQNMSTAMVVTQLIAPETKGKVGKKYIATMDPSHLGPPTHFVCHCHSGRFHHLLQSIEEHMTNCSATPLSPAKIFLWIDIFAIAQNPEGTAHAETDLIVVKAALSRISGFIVCLGESCEALTRCWTLFEILRAHGMRQRTMSYGESQLPIQLLSKGVEPGILEKEFAGLDLEGSLCTLDKDRKSLLDEVRTTTPFFKANQVIRSALVEAAKQDAKEAMSLVQTVPMAHVMRLHAAGRLLQGFGELDAGCANIQEALKSCENVYGPKDEVTLVIKNSYAAMLVKLGNASEAETLMRAVLRVEDRKWPGQAK